MSNIFFEGSHANFSWGKLGDIAAGRASIGDMLPVEVYRLMEFTMNDVLTKEFGAEKAGDLFRRSGYLAGSQFAENKLDLDMDVNSFFSKLQSVLLQLKIGILRIESFDAESGQIRLTVAEDLDCSGLPISNETVCTYDEGFLSGILDVYTKKSYNVREIDCWANGARVCRFKCSPKE